MTPFLTYVYCLVKSPRRPVLRGASPGIGGGEVRALDAGDGMWLIVASVPESGYGEAALAHGLQDLDWVGRQAMAHEAVVERLLTAPSVLPMQLFTLFTSDERALQHVRRGRRRIAAILARVERQVEWGLRLTLDGQVPPPAGPRRARVGRTADPDGRRTAADGRAGTAYLARRREQLEIGRTRLAEARTEADRLYRTMARAATAAVRRGATEQAVPGSRLVLDAAFLVPRPQAAAFRALVRRHGRPLSAAGLVVSLTGPWPPYNFIGSGTRTRRRA